MSRPPDPHAKIDLLRAAEAVFLEHGLDRARVEDITARAGRSKGAFYLHFESKEEAFRQIVESFLARLHGCVEAFTEAFEGAPVSDVRQFLTQCREGDVQIFEFLWQNRGVVRLILEGGGSSKFGYLIDEFAERSRQNTKRLLRWGVRQGLYRDDLDVEVASLVISGAYDRVARDLVHRERKPNLEQLLGELQRVLFGGIVHPLHVVVSDSKVKNRSRRA
jgi:AcrR family transcriptional regulator